MREEERFLAAYDALGDAVFRYIAMRVSSREVARDLTQETFTHTWEYLAKGKPIENMKPFIFRTAHNLVIDHYRAKKEVSLEALAEAGFDPPGATSTDVESLARGREALVALAKLDEPYRQIVTLRYVNDLTIGEIAETLRISENAVSVALHRAHKKLESLLTYGKL